MPVLLDVPPVPEAVIEMSLSKCKIVCSTTRCKCKKNSMVCTEMCLCYGCENVPVDEDLEFPIAHDDDKVNGI